MGIRKGAYKSQGRKVELLGLYQVPAFRLVFHDALDSDALQNTDATPHVSTCR